MKTFVITFQNELIRLYRRKKLIAGVVAAAFIPFGAVLLKVLTLGWQPTLIYREDLFRLALSILTPLVLPLFALGLTTDAFMEEQAKGSLKTSVLLPDTRTGHFAAKVLSCFTGTSLMMAALWLSSLISGMLLPSRGGYMLSLGIGLLQGTASLLPILMVLGFSSLASQWIKSASGMMLTLIGLALVMNLSPLWIGNLSTILPTNWLGFGSNIAYISTSALFQALSGMLLWTVFSGGLALLRFERRML